MATLPIESTSGLNQVITLASPGVVADANGFFHPVGDHAQTQFSIDNQPVTDQQSRVYSNQISPDAVQSMEAITGVPPAEFGDKDSLVVRIVTKSGLDQAKPTGSMSVGYGSFKTPTGEINLGIGNHKVGNFLSFSGMRTDRYLDPPEFDALHDTGNSQSFFDRFDAGAFHLNLQVAARRSTCRTRSIRPTPARISIRRSTRSTSRRVTRRPQARMSSLRPTATCAGTILSTRPARIRLRTARQRSHRIANSRTTARRWTSRTCARRTTSSSAAPSMPRSSTRHLPSA